MAAKAGIEMKQSKEERKKKGRRGPKKERRKGSGKLV